MNKEIHKAVMEWSSLTNKFIKENTSFSKEACNKQGNYRLKLKTGSKVTSKILFKRHNRQ